MIVKMIILRLLGSSDDKEKEKIGVARPEGPPLRGFRYPGSGRGSRGSRPSRVSGQRPESSQLVAPEEPTHEASVHPIVVGRTDATAEENQSQVRLWAPDEPTGQKGASVHWASYVPETISRAQEKILQHRFNRWCIGVLRRCNDVSAQEKILKHRMNR
jgi:hypothetical protein